MGEDEKDMLLRQLDELGEEEIRLRVKSPGRYDCVQRPFMLNELERRDRQRADEAARKADRRAMTANMLSATALIVAIVALVGPLLWRG